MRSSLHLLACVILWLAQPAQARASLWCTAYYPGWTQGYMRATNIDFSALTHVIHFSVIPTSTGILDTSGNSVSAANSAGIVTNGHAAGVKVLICVGGAGTVAGFQNAASPTYRAIFISNLVQFATNRAYDGIDIDWEPLAAADAANFTNFVIGLRNAMNAAKPGLLLTAAAATQPGLYAAVQERFDQINIMTYDLSGPWPGWITWFNSPLYDGGTRFPSTGGLVPSIDGSVNDFVSHGVAAKKLGIGVPFYGYTWGAGSGTTAGGATLPRQTWTIAPTNGAQPYYYIVTNWYQASRYRWDTNAQVPYLTIDSPGSANDKFISYEDEESCRRKIRYARSKEIGGVMVWELSQGWRAELPPGQRDPLLLAMKQELALDLVVRQASLVTNTLVFEFASVAGRTYRIESASQLPAANWQLLTNLSATSATTAARVPFLPEGSRFIRVRQ